MGRTGQHGGEGPGAGTSMSQLCLPMLNLLLSLPPSLLPSLPPFPSIFLPSSHLLNAIISCLGHGALSDQ